MLSGFWRTSIALGILSLVSAAVADDAFYEVRINDLRITEGDRPQRPSAADWRQRARTWAMLPYVVLDGQGEAYIRPDGDRLVEQVEWAGSAPLASDAQSIVIHTDQARDISGRLFYPKPDWSGMVMVRFTVPAAEAKPEARQSFYRGKQTYYRRMMARSLPGTAWFRHEASQAQRSLAGEAKQDSSTAAPVDTETPPQPPMREDELTRTYALFSGGRAVSENLQLDRALRGAKREEPTVATDSIEGISVPEMDWKQLVKDLKPQLDPLASWIPADQHVVFFPSFAAAVLTSDQAAEQGTPILQLAEPRSEDAGVAQRYERQLCLSLTGLGRILGPQMVASVALTGSDPYYRTGTDVAVLFEASNPTLLANLLWAQISLAASKTPAAKPEQGKVGDLAYRGVRSPDRGICSYLVQLDRAVVVTNSLAQLERLASVVKKESPSIASLPEYTFFRDRYRRDAPEETALVFLSDATIRRWCGPRWRIATSRRLRDMAVLAELQASRLDALVKGDVQAGPIETDLAAADIGELTLDAVGVRSSSQGTLEFMTPIAEIPLPKVSKAEADAYRQWRDGYQRNWRWAFDPIALRITLQIERLAADLSVMPLIAATEYREFLAISEGAHFAPNAGDPHDALVHFILAINTKSPMFNRADNFLGTMSKGATLGWLGSSVAVFAEADPVWEELAKLAAKNPNEAERSLFRYIGRLPIGIRAEVSDGFRLTAFLAALRAFVEQTAPGMIQWESLTYKDQPYVKVSPTDRAKGQHAELQSIVIYYAASGDALLLTLNEAVMKRSIDRQLARAAGGKTEAKADGKTDVNPADPADSKSDGQSAASDATVSERPWLGSNIGLQVDRKAIETFGYVNRTRRQQAMQVLAWSNLLVLNEWKRLYPDQDPVDVHQRVWRIKLICPGGGRYVWNEKWQTMESTVYGHPGEPKEGPELAAALNDVTHGSLGVTFEHQGLRARVSLDRNTPAEPNAK